MHSVELEAMVSQRKKSSYLIKKHRIPLIRAAAQAQLLSKYSEVISARHTNKEQMENASRAGLSRCLHRELVGEVHKILNLCFNYIFLTITRLHNYIWWTEYTTQSTSTRLSNHTSLRHTGIYSVWNHTSLLTNISFSIGCEKLWVSLGNSEDLVLHPSV